MNSDGARAYDRIIGLGHNCRVAYNLRRTFGEARAYPFDWWVTPLTGLLAVLQDLSVDRLYDPDALEPVHDERGVRAIRNARYDIELHHEFPRDHKSLVLPDWADHIARPRARTAYLLDRFLALPEGSRLLFVRQVSKQDWRDLGDGFHDAIGALRERLAELFPMASVELLLIDSPASSRAPGVSDIWIVDAEEIDWRGTPQLWTERLRAAGIALAGQGVAAVEPDPDADMAGFAEDASQGLQEAEGT